MVGIGLLNEWIRINQKDGVEPFDSLHDKLLEFLDGGERLLVCIDECQDVQDEFLPILSVLSRTSAQDNAALMRGCLAGSELSHRHSEICLHAGRSKGLALEEATGD